MGSYFNNAFSKRPLPEAVEAMQPFLREEFENPLTESEGAERARGVLDSARHAVAELLNAQPHEIYFTSSGTEANNWALKGATWNEKKNHIVISAIEHFSIYQTAQFLERHGFEVTIVPVDERGMVDVQRIADAVRTNTCIVSVQSASDEIGVIQDIHRIAQLRKDHEHVLFHSDAIQYLCYETLDVRSTPLDLVSLSSNAIYGPPGIAALYIKEGTRFVPLLHGGMQEGGMRPGLQSMALVAGFGAAARMNRIHKKDWRLKVAELQQQLLIALQRLPLVITANESRRLVDNVHVIADVDGEAVLTLLQDQNINASSGSTCYQFAQKESHVLKALQIDAPRARGALLFTLGIDHSQENISLLCETLDRVLSHLGNLKP
jgi:cysteine desulfurase